MTARQATIMEIPERAPKPWFCNTTAESGASIIASAAIACHRKLFLPRMNPKSALSASKIKIMMPPTPLRNRGVRPLSRISCIPSAVAVNAAAALQPVAVERVSGNHKSPGGGDTDCETLRQNFSDDTHTRVLPPSSPGNLRCQCDKFGGFLGRRHGGP